MGKVVAVNVVALGSRRNKRQKSDRHHQCFVAHVCIFGILLFGTQQLLPFGKSRPCALLRSHGSAAAYGGQRAVPGPLPSLRSAARCARRAAQALQSLTAFGPGAFGSAGAHFGVSANCLPPSLAPSAPPRLPICGPLAALGRRRLVRGLRPTHSPSRSLRATGPSGLRPFGSGPRLAPAAARRKDRRCLTVTCNIPSNSDD